VPPQLLVPVSRAAYSLLPPAVGFGCGLGPRRFRNSSARLLVPWEHWGPNTDGQSPNGHEHVFEMGTPKPCPRQIGRRTNYDLDLGSWASQIFSISSVLKFLAPEAWLPCKLGLNIAVLWGGRPISRSLAILNGRRWPPEQFLWAGRPVGRLNLAARIAPRVALLPGVFPLWFFMERICLPPLRRGAWMPRSVVFDRPCAKPARGVWGKRCAANASGQKPTSGWTVFNNPPSRRPNLCLPPGAYLEKGKSNEPHVFAVASVGRNIISKLSPGWMD